MADSFPIDLPDFKSRTLGNAALQAELLRLFKIHAPATLEIAATAVAQGDLASAGRALHKLKGSAATISATAMARATGQAESCIRAQDAASLTVALSLMRQELDRCLRQIDDLTAASE